MRSISLHIPSFLLSPLRDKVEKEERKTLAAAGCNVTERVFSAEEVGCPSLPPHFLPPSLSLQLSGKLITERRRFQLGVCEVKGGRCCLGCEWESGLVHCVLTERMLCTFLTSH